MAYQLRCPVTVPIPLNPMFLTALNAVNTVSLEVSIFGGSNNRVKSIHLVHLTPKPMVPTSVFCL